MILNIKKSFILTAIVFSAHFGALLLIAVIPIPPGFKIGLAAMIGASFWWQFRHGTWVSVCELRVEEDGSCICTANGEQRRYRVARATAHAGFVRLMLMREGERTRTQLIPRDTVEPEVYRTVRARIVQRRLPVSEKSPA